MKQQLDIDLSQPEAAHEIAMLIHRTRFDARGDELDECHRLFATLIRDRIISEGIAKAEIDAAYRAISAADAAVRDAIGSDFVTF